MGFKEELDLLDAKINKLKADYEQYFMKTLKKEPAALRGEIDRLILKYSNQSISNTSLKFRYSTLASKYTSYKQFWNRILRQIEEGAFERGASFAAKPPERPSSESLKHQQKPASASDELKKPVPENPPQSDEFKAIYQQFMEAKKATGESAADMPYEKFAQAIVQQTEKVKQDLKCSDVEYKVFVKDGKAKITLIPRK